MRSARQHLGTSWLCVDTGHRLQVKKGPLAEVAPMLNDISGLESWRKVRLMQQACLMHKPAADGSMLSG